MDEPLCVEVDGTSIIVTMPGTDFSVTYQKEIDAPHLVLTHMGSATSTNHEFRARAFHAAVEKARELSWIV